MADLETATISQAAALVTDRLGAPVTVATVERTLARMVEEGEIIRQGGAWALRARDVDRLTGRLARFRSGWWLSTNRKGDYLAYVGLPNGVSEIVTLPYGGLIASRRQLVERAIPDEIAATEWPTGYQTATLHRIEDREGLPAYARVERGREAE